MNTATDKAGFVKLIEENKGIILKICGSYCNNPSDREDLAQEIIYQLWKSGKNFNPDYKFSTWMYRVALNVAISYYRKEKKGPQLTPVEELHIDIIEDTTVDNEKERNLQLLQQFIAELKQLDKALILLWFEDKSYKEIADIMGITETNVATRINRVKQQLKNKFEVHKTSE